MPDSGVYVRNRRRFLAALGASPLLLAQQDEALLADPLQAINVMDFEAPARKMLPPAHWGYMATGVEDDLTLRANREAFSRMHLRPRRLVDISKVDLRTRIYGTTWESPIALAPVGNQKAFHPKGEIAVAGAARNKSALMILSTSTNSSVEDVSKEYGRPVWYQLYTSSRWDVTEKIVKRVEAAGCPVLVVTVDTQAGRRTETFERFKRLDKRDCTACHGPERRDFYRRKPMFEGVDFTNLGTTNPAMTWEHVTRLRNMTSMKLLIKGIETWEDTKLCRNAGLDGVVVSNHGGRAEESGRGTLDCLPEVIEAAGPEMPVFIDGGFRRGSDVFKALALGARAVFIGRPYVWGLACFGQPGVERVLDLLRLELQLTMKQCGTRSVAEITRTCVGYNKA